MQTVTYFGNLLTEGEFPELSLAGQPVVVQRSHCRCLAYQDRNGRWRDYFHNDELTDVVSEMSLDD